ncbi:hypothetical protein [Pontibacter harenae]|uniref:hypothetical protein n=1 Tax=Pontibacter harenae TaxID=2894083 RepID=UPI001E2E9037|nr:hypothetical protein [Pontibacter harenae]MCC9166234.1 hypothetical protein [Pontibacter harenae]
MLKLIYPLCMFLLLWQCQDETTQTSSEQYTVTDDGIKFGQEFSLYKGDAITLYGGEALRRLHLMLEQLNDSRCPANANCNHYGSAAAKFSAANSQGKNENIELCIGNCAPGDMRSTHTVTLAVGQTNYKITLKDV